MSITHYVEIELTINVEYDDGEPYGVIDAPPEVQRWLADKIGLRGMLRIDEEVRHHCQVEAQNAAADAAEQRQAYHEHEALRRADYA